MIVRWCAWRHTLTPRELIEIVMGGEKYCNQDGSPEFHLDAKIKDLFTFISGAGQYEREY